MASLSHFLLLKELASLPGDVPIPADTLAMALSTAPFVSSVPGAINLRDLGASAPAFMAASKVYRSGRLDSLPESSRALLRSQLGIKTVYDLRRDDEVRAPVATTTGDEPEVVRCPYKAGADISNPIVLEDFVLGPGGAVGVGFRKLYDDVLEGYVAGFRTIFEALRDMKEGEAVLIHCTGRLTGNSPPF